MTGSIRNFEKLNFTPKSSVFCSSQGQTSKYDRLAQVFGIDEISNTELIGQSAMRRFSNHSQPNDSKYYLDLLD